MRVGMDVVDEVGRDRRTGRGRQGSQMAGPDITEETPGQETRNGQRREGQAADQLVDANRVLGKEAENRHDQRRHHRSPRDGRGIIETRGIDPVTGELLRDDELNRIPSDLIDIARVVEVDREHHEAPEDRGQPAARAGTVRGGRCRRESHSRDQGRLGRGPIAPGRQSDSVPGDIPLTPAANYPCSARLVPFTGPS